MPPSRPRTSSPSAKASRSNSGKPLTEKSRARCSSVSGFFVRWPGGSASVPACVGMTGCRDVKYVRVPCVRASVRPCAHISRVHATVRPVLPSIRTTCPSIPRLHIERTSPLHRPHEAHRRSVHRPPHRRRPLRMARNTNNRRTHADCGSSSEPAATAAEEPVHAPNAQSSAYMRHPTKRYSKLPATSPHARNSYPSYRRTSQHIVRSIAHL